MGAGGLSVFDPQWGSPMVSERRARLPQCVAVAGLLTLPGAGALAATAAGWPTAAGALDGGRYAALSEITTANVGTLVQDFAFPTGATGNHEGQPLVVGKMLYLVTPYPNTLIAIDLAAPKKAKWTFSPAVSSVAIGKACCDTVNRGAAYDNGTLFINTVDATTVAVDAATGTQKWRTRIADPLTGVTLTGAPIVVNGKVIVGSSGGEFGVRGFIQALNETTGKPVWKAYNTGPDADVLIGPGFKPYYAKDQGTDLGATSWPGTMWQHGGATAWGWFTYDASSNLLYYGTANPGVWNPDLRRGDNKWASSIIARNPDTGQAAWAYQVTPHDAWDFDAVNESIVADVTVGGVSRKALVHFNKNGFAYTLDRATGRLLRVAAFANQNWSKGVSYANGAPVPVAGKVPHTGVVTENVCPSPLGAKDWEPASHSPATGLFYVPAINLCSYTMPLKAFYVGGAPYVGADAHIVPGPGGNLGELIAWNAGTATRAWSVPEALPLYGGTLATAGNLVFYGTLDKYFRAVNATTGAKVWEKKLECGIASAPISFTGADGHQRVAIMTGTGWLSGAFSGGACPSIFSGSSGMLHVYKLP